MVHRTNDAHTHAPKSVIAVVQATVIQTLRFVPVSPKYGFVLLGPPADLFSIIDDVVLPTSIVAIVKASHVKGPKR